MQAGGRRFDPDYLHQRAKPANQIAIQRSDCDLEEEKERSDTEFSPEGAARRRKRSERSFFDDGPIAQLARAHD